MEKEIKKYKSYEDYLDSLIIEEDQKYLSDVETARQLVSLGYRYNIFNFMAMVFRYYRFYFGLLFLDLLERL